MKQQSIYKTSTARRCMMLFFTVMIAVTQVGTVVSAKEKSMDREFYSGNDIIYYDPNAISCPINATSASDTGSTMTGSDTAEKIFNFLTSTRFKGLNNSPMNSIQAAGVLGNMQHESGMDPSQKQNGGGGGRGLVQWDDRAAALYAFADKQGKSWTDLGVQLDYLKVELDGSEGSGLSRAGFSKVSTPKEAAVMFVDVFERAGVKAYAERIKFAESYYAKFASTAGSGNAVQVGGSTPQATGGCRAASTAGNGPIGDFMSDSFVSFSQCSNAANGGGAWGNKTDTHGQKMCAVGCGPTSVAMVIHNLAGNKITPQDSLDYYNKNNLWDPFGSSSQAFVKMAKSYNISSEQFNPRNLDEYKKIFAAGGVAIIGGMGAEPFYTGFGHYVVVRGLTKDGKFLISDPGRGKASEFSTTQIMLSAAKRAYNARAFYPPGGPSLAA